jgi:predicted acetyltransferase
VGVDRHGVNRVELNKHGWARTVSNRRPSSNYLHEYPIAALLASEGGIYGRFGYGAAAIEQRLRVQRRFHPEVPDPGGVKVISAAEHSNELAAIDERWRRCTPGGLHTPLAVG